MTTDAINGAERHRVMVVDDHPDTREVFDVVLNLRGFEVTAPATVALAFAELQHEPRPCVVLLDLHMPEIDGWTFIDCVRGEPECAELPLVIVSGDLAQRMRAEERGFDFLPKPVAPDELVAAVERHCRRHRDLTRDVGVRNG